MRWVIYVLKLVLCVCVAFIQLLKSNCLVAERNIAEIRELDTAPTLAQSRQRVAAPTFGGAGDSEESEMLPTIEED